MALRVCVFANKVWEVQPLVAVLSSDQATPGPFSSVTAPSVQIPLNDGTPKTVSARYAVQTANASVEVWCVKDLMDPIKSASSSEEKARVLTEFAKRTGKVDLAIAFGTAALPGPATNNGSVTVGSNFYVYDAKPNGQNPSSKWSDGQFGQLQDSTSQSLNTGLFKALDQKFRTQIEIRFLPCVCNPCPNPALLLSPAFVAVSDVNITDWNDYVWADPAALDAFAGAYSNRVVGSMETTHGVIRLSVPASQYLFVSGIANRVGFFTYETAIRPYAQDFAAAHNAGVALAWAIPLLA